MSAAQSPMKATNANGRRRTVETIELELAPDLVDLLNAFVSDRNDMSHEEAVEIALREWAKDRGLLPREPPGVVPIEKLNAQNDG